MIPAEAVEAAIKGFTVRAQDHSTPSTGEVFKECLTAALEAAAPYMLAEAWDAGYEQADSDAPHAIKSENPYRQR